MPLFGQQMLGLMDHLGDREGGAGRHLVGRQRDTRGRRRRAGPRPGDADRDARARQRPPRLRHRLHPAPGLADFRRADIAGGRDAWPTSCPGAGPLLGQMLLDWVGQDPKPSASVLQGLFFGRTAPPRSERRTLKSPGTGDRPPARSDPPVLGLRHARAGAAARAARRGLIDPGAADLARAAHGRDRHVRRRVLGRSAPPQRKAAQARDREPQRRWGDPAPPPIGVASRHGPRGLSPASRRRISARRGGGLALAVFGRTVLKRLILIERDLSKPVEPVWCDLEFRLALLGPGEIDTYLAYRPERTRYESDAALRARLGVLRGVDRRPDRLGLPGTNTERLGLRTSAAGSRSLGTRPTPTTPTRRPHCAGKA